MAGLKVVLDDLAEQISSGQLSSQQTTQLSILVQGCQKVLHDLDTEVKKHEGLDMHGSGLGAKGKRLVKKVKWDQKGIDELRSRLISNISLLETFNVGIARYTRFSILPLKLYGLEAYLYCIYIRAYHSNTDVLLQSVVSCYRSKD